MKYFKVSTILSLMLIVVVNVYVANQNIDVNNSILDLESLEAKGYELLETGTYSYDSKGNLIKENGSAWQRVCREEQGYWDSHGKFHGTVYFEDHCMPAAGLKICEIPAKREWYMVYP